eukprot:IDg21488t1
MTSNNSYTHLIGTQLSRRSKATTRQEEESSEDTSDDSDEELAYEGLSSSRREIEECRVGDRKKGFASSAAQKTNSPLWYLTSHTAYRHNNPPVHASSTAGEKEHDIPCSSSGIVNVQ